MSDEPYKEFRTESMENTSGRGELSTVPSEVSGWSWGAFSLSVFWGLANRTYSGLLVFVPIIGFFVPFVLGFKGNEWAWRNKRWDSVEAFKRTQRKWTIAGLAVFICSVLYSAVFIHSLESINPLAGHTTKESGSHGLLKYRLFDVKTNTVISSGSEEIKEIYTLRKPGFPEKRYFKLFDDFIIGMGFENGGYSDSNDVGGFGMWLERLNIGTDSWEWYTQIDQSTFEKMQGVGKVKVDYKEKNGRLAIARIVFIGDQMFRSRQNGFLRSLRFIFQRGNYKDWTCTILDGSYIEWDSKPYITPTAVPPHAANSKSDQKGLVLSSCGASVRALVLLKENFLSRNGYTLDHDADTITRSSGSPPECRELSQLVDQRK